MQRDQADIEKGLLTKGFLKADGDHHYFHYHDAVGGKKTRIFTKTSHGNKEIGDPLIAKMAKQCGLTKAEFLNLVDCPLQRTEYEKLLIDRGKIIPPAQAAQANNNAKPSRG
jgi:predicted RNA binding protein YcfA (HicA-like mRNA interferase family)